MAKKKKAPRTTLYVMFRRDAEQVARKLEDAARSIRDLHDAPERLVESRIKDIENKLKQALSDLDNVAVKKERAS